MPHPLVLQLRFARSEFKRALVGLTDEEARRRFLPMNCIAWNIGHLAWQEQRYWLYRGQGFLLLPHIQEQFAISKEAFFRHQARPATPGTGPSCAISLSPGLSSTAVTLTSSPSEMSPRHGRVPDHSRNRSSASG